MPSSNKETRLPSSHEGFLQKFPRLGGIITQRGAGKRVENYGGVAFAPRFVEWMKRKERRKERRRRRASKRVSERGANEREARSGKRERFFSRRSHLGTQRRRRRRLHRSLARFFPAHSVTPVNCYGDIFAAGNLIKRRRRRRCRSPLPMRASHRLLIRRFGSRGLASSLA